ncbi:MAG: lactate utilization protein [Bryobacteraceae bacterium]|jgi:L-lactate dehydrogenase complex protein LldG
MNREAMLERVRMALGRKPGEPPEPPPPVYLPKVERSAEHRIALFTAALEELAGRVVRCPSRDATRNAVSAMIAGKRAIASRASYLRECAIPDIENVPSDFSDAAAYRQVCAAADVGITSADYALADTGTLVMISGAEESRLVSLLPPAHIAVVPVSRLLENLDELLLRVPRPADTTSSMVLITGPSRTADIEQILVRGVHGPGEITVILVDD